MEILDQRHALQAMAPCKPLQAIASHAMPYACMLSNDQREATQAPETISGRVAFVPCLVRLPSRTFECTASIHSLAHRIRLLVP